MIKKLCVLLVIGLLCITCAYASNFVPAKSVTDDSVDFLVGTTNTLYTKTINMRNIPPDVEVGLMYKATAIQNGTINLNVKAQQSYKPPTTEGAVDTAFMDVKSIETSLADENWRLATLDSTVLPYLRFKVRGDGSNAAGTTFQIKVIK